MLLKNISKYRRLSAAKITVAWFGGKNCKSLVFMDVIF